MQIPDRVGNLAQWVGPVDDGPDLANFDEPLQEFQVVCVRCPKHWAQSLADEGRYDECLHGSTQGADPPITAFAADEHERPAWRECPPEL